MELSRKDLKTYLKTYGVNFNSWPTQPSTDQIEEIRNMPEYHENAFLDLVMNDMAWPKVSSEIRKSLFAEIAKTPFSNNIAPSQFMLILSRPVFLMTCILMFLCLGMTSGSYYKSTSHNTTAYQYVYADPSYSFGTSIGGIYVQ